MRWLLPGWFCACLLACAAAAPSGGLGWWALVPILGTAAGTALASVRPELGLYAPIVQRGTGDRVALTFDDGPDPEHTLAIADALEAHGARGTFFCVGEQAARYPDVVGELARRGHQIAQHSHRHRWWHMLWYPAAARDLERAHAALEAATGARPAWYRPPVGLITPELLDAARDAGCTVAGWSVRPFDGGLTPPEEVARRVVAALHPGAIVLLHDHRRLDGGPPSARAALPTILRGVRERGLEAVTLAELLERPAQQVGEPRRGPRSRLPLLAAVQTVASVWSLTAGLT